MRFPRTLLLHSINNEIWLRKLFSFFYFFTSFNLHNFYYTEPSYRIQCTTLGELTNIKQLLNRWLILLLDLIYTPVISYYTKWTTLSKFRRPWRSNNSDNPNNDFHWSRSRRSGQSSCIRVQREISFDAREESW